MGRVHPPKFLRATTHSVGHPGWGPGAQALGLVCPSGPGQAVVEAGRRAHSREPLSDLAPPLTSWWPWTSPSTSEPRLPPQKKGVIVPYPEGFLENHSTRGFGRCLQYTGALTLSLIRWRYLQTRWRNDGRQLCLRYLTVPGTGPPGGAHLPPPVPGLVSWLLAPRGALLRGQQGPQRKPGVCKVSWSTNMGGG